MNTTVKTRTERRIIMLTRREDLKSAATGNLVAVSSQGRCICARDLRSSFARFQHELLKTLSNPSQLCERSLYWHEPKCSYPSLQATSILNGRDTPSICLPTCRSPRPSVDPHRPLQESEHRTESHMFQEVARRQEGLPINP